MMPHGVMSPTWSSQWWSGRFPGQVYEELLRIVQVAFKLGLIEDLGDYRNLPRSRFGEPYGDGLGSSQEWPGDYIIFICYLVALIEVHSTCAKKREILFLSKKTFLLLSMSSFLTKVAYVLQVVTMFIDEHLEKEVKENQIVNLKFVVSIYNCTSMFINAKSEIRFQMLWLKMDLDKLIVV
jgi:hypothetical protein